MVTIMNNAFYTDQKQYQISRVPSTNGTTTVHALGKVPSDEIDIFKSTILKLEERNDDVCVVEFLTPTCCRLTGWIPIDKIELAYLDVVTDPNR